MDKILLLLSIPGIGLSRAKSFLRDNKLLIDDDYFHYLLSEYTGISLSVYIDEVKRIKENCKKLGVDIIKCRNSNIIDAPIILFTKGDSAILSSEKIIGVVGTREPSLKAEKLGSRITEYLAETGWIIISGLARGCDTIAHRSCIKAGGRTIAVLPCGYRANLSPWILEGGIIVSEYPPYTPVRKYRCVKRNRIITGYSKGLYVIETGNDGGSMRSVEYACNKDVPIAYSFGFNSLKRYCVQNVLCIRDMDMFLEINITS